MKDRRSGKERRGLWLPIATHPPNDPSPVLLFWPYWSQVPVIGDRYAGGPWSTEKWLGEDAEDPGPTHWMPLPDNPTK
jgi:hypothetical protein